MEHLLDSVHLATTVAMLSAGRLRRTIGARRTVHAVSVARRAIRGLVWTVIRTVITVRLILACGLRLLRSRGTLAVSASIIRREVGNCLKGSDPHITLTGESDDLFVVCAGDAL
jgi:hypothetical protein